jgi:hypothetical protein
MFLAAKVEEIAVPSAMNFLYCAHSSYTEAEILQAKEYILKTLKWNISYPNLIQVSNTDKHCYFVHVHSAHFPLFAPLLYQFSDNPCITLLFHSIT